MEEKKLKKANVRWAERKVREHFISCQVSAICELMSDYLSHGILPSASSNTLIKVAESSGHANAQVLTLKKTQPGKLLSDKHISLDEKCTIVDFVERERSTNTRGREKKLIL